ADGYVERRSPFSTGEASLLADSAADLVYVGSSTGDGLIAYAVEGYGGLREVGFGTQCGSTRVVSVTPVAAVRGFGIASGWSWDAKSRVLCSFEGRGLVPRESLGPGFAEVGAAFAPSEPPRLDGAPGSSPLVGALVVVDVGTDSHWEIRLYALQPGG